MRNKESKFERLLASIFLSSRANTTPIETGRDPNLVMPGSMAGLTLARTAIEGKMKAISFNMGLAVLIPTC